MEDVITNYVPILLEEDAMETIRSRGFVRFHRVEGSKNIIFGNRRGEGIFSSVIKNRVASFIEGSVMGWLVAAKKNFEIFLGFFLENSAVRSSDVVWELQPVNSVSLSSNDCLCMKE